MRTARRAGLFSLHGNRLPLVKSNNLICYHSLILLFGFLFDCLFHLLLSYAWRSPDTSRVRSKMIYASSKDRFKRELDGIQIELQATDPTEMGLDVIRSRLNWILCLPCKGVHIIEFNKFTVYIFELRFFLLNFLLLCLWINGASIPSSVVLTYSYMMVCGGVYINLICLEAFIICCTPNRVKSTFN